MDKYIDWTVAETKYAKAKTNGAWKKTMWTMYKWMASLSPAVNKNI